MSSMFRARRSSGFLARRLGLLLVAAPSAVCFQHPLGPSRASSRRVILPHDFWSLRMSDSGWRRRSSASQKAEAARLEAVARACSEGDIQEMETEAVTSRYGYPATTATYGEITPKGFGTLATRLRLSPADS